MFRRPIVCVAHPGHELRIWGWIRKYKPEVHVLTDGSGRNAQPRIQETSSLLENIGTQPGSIFGECSDREFYAALLDQNCKFFRALLDRLVTALVESNADAIIGDAYEGFNPTHDLCRALVDAAAIITSQRLPHGIGNYDFSVTEFETGNEPPLEGDASCLMLDDGALEEKILAARGFGGLEHEVEDAVRAYGAGYFRAEKIRRIHTPFAQPLQGSHYYEKVGAERVNAGLYEARIEYARHIEPILLYLRAQAEKEKSFLASTV